MPRIGCTRIRFVPILSLALVAAALGCGEDLQSPGAPELGPALAVKSAGALSFRQVSAGLSHTCGVTTGNLAYCWGSGELGSGTTGRSLTPVAVAGGLRFREVSAGAVHTCGVTTGNLAYCWGRNLAGQLGDGTRTSRSTPVAVAGGLRFRQLSMGDWHTCGVSLGNVAYCWGQNDIGQVGDGTVLDYPGSRLTPVAVAGGLRFREVTTGSYHSCGVATGNVAFCWGNNANWQLGSTVAGYNILKPGAVAGGLRFLQLTAGGDHTCGVAGGNVAYCWGKNVEGELGIGTTDPSKTPVAVAAPAP